MTRELFENETSKPGLPVLVLLFVMLFALGTGCTTDTVLEELPTETNPEEEPAPEPDPEEEPVPEPELEDGPVPFEVLRSDRSEESQRVFSCRFNYESIDLNLTNEESLSALELVIDSQIDFDTYISCDDTVNVDFEKEFVLAGKTTGLPAQVRTKELTVELVDGIVYFRVGLLHGHTTTPSSAEYIIKVKSREHSKYPVFFDIYWEQ